MGTIVKNKLMVEGGPPSPIEGFPRYRGGPGAHPNDVWYFSEMDLPGWWQQYPHVTALVKDWMAFLKTHRSPRKWCRGSRDTGYLAEEGYGSTVLYRQRPANPPQWLSDQGRVFMRVIRMLYNRDLEDGQRGERAREAAKRLTETNGARSNFEGLLSGRFGGGGSGTRAEDVLALLVSVSPVIDTEPRVRQYLEALNPGFTQCAVSFTHPGTASHGPSTHPGTASQGPAIHPRTAPQGQCGWYNTLMPAFNRLISDMTENIHHHPERSDPSRRYRGQGTPAGTALAQWRADSGNDYSPSERTTRVATNQFTRLDDCGRYTETPQAS